MREKCITICPMRIGYRVVDPGEVGKWGGELVQISLYRGRGNNSKRLAEISRACHERSMSYVLHPVGYSLLMPEDLGDLRLMAEQAGEALILHDERAPGGGRLEGREGEAFGAALEDLGSRARLSLENSTHTADVVWFWERFGGSVTLDMGHMESAGLNSVEFVRRLDKDIIRRVDYVHMHRNGTLRGGLTDHHPLRQGCRELEALRALLVMKSDVGVLLEINEREETEESMALLSELREELRLGFRE